MRAKHSDEADYQWDFLREWCLWYIGVFLQYAAMTEPKYDWFEKHSKEQTLDWSRVKKSGNIFARYVVETITSQVSEASATREALPGDFADAVVVVRAEEALLQRAMSPEDTWREMEIIDG